MPPFKQQPSKPTPAEILARGQEIIARNKKLSEERAQKELLEAPSLPPLPEDVSKLKREVVRGKQSQPLPRIIGKSAAAGRDDAPVLKYDPITKTHTVVEEE